MYTYTMKEQMYRAGQYKSKTPPVCTLYWDEQDWIDWIDRNGKWLP